MEKHENAGDITLAISRSKPTAGLYLIATPIGNLKDITLRALELLISADIIICEDTRITQRLLQHYGISGARMFCYNDNSGEKEREAILRHLHENKVLALVSDAGTPLIADPGYKLVREVIAAGYKVESLPGASSAIVALTLSGFPTDSFLFKGFLPPKSAGRQKALSAIKDIPASVIFFEAARRLEDTLTDIVMVLGEKRQISISRELTKRFEETKRGSALELLQYYQKEGEPKGEVVIVVAPPSKETEEVSEDVLDAMLINALKDNPISRAVKTVCQQTGKDRSEVYARALALQGK